MTVYRVFASNYGIPVWNKAASDMIVTIYFVQETFFLLFTDGRTFYLHLLFTGACRVSDKCKWIFHSQCNFCDVAEIEAHFNNIRNPAFKAK